MSCSNISFSYSCKTVPCFSASLGTSHSPYHFTSPDLDKHPPTQHDTHFNTILSSSPNPTEPSQPFFQTPQLHPLTLPYSH